MNNDPIEALESLLKAMEMTFEVIKDINKSINMVTAENTELKVQVELLKLRVSNLEYCTQTKFYMKNGGQG